MADADFFDQIKLFLPKYLTPTQTSELFSELSRFPENKSFYLFGPEWGEQLLQGDGWRGFVALNFVTGERKDVSGVIISNSCDIDPAHVRDVPVNVLFAPLIDLGRYVELLRDARKSPRQIEDVLRDIRRQRVTSIFYLPDHPTGVPEAMILFNDIHAHPLQDFGRRSKVSLFTLNQYAFYLFLIKLSIHFARFQEDVRRFDNAA